MALRWSTDRSYTLGNVGGLTEYQGSTCGDCGALVLNRGLHDRFHENLGGAGHEAQRPRVAFRR
jgi:hypothetical protein